MTRKALPVLFCLLASSAFAGGQINVDRVEEAWFCQIVASDGTIAATSDGISCNGQATAGALVDATTFASRTHVPPNRSLLIEDWGIVVLDTLGATEVCPVILVTDNTPTGAGSAVSTITTNEGTGAEDDCDEGVNADLDTAGETCTISNVNALILGGGYMRFELTDGGACTVFQSGLLWARGRFLP